MKTKLRISDQLIEEKELPYTLYCLMSAFFMAFFVPVVLMYPFSDSLSAIIYSAGVLLQLLGILLFHRHWHFLAMIIVIIVNSFVIFWATYRFGRATGGMLFYFPFMLAYLYIVMYNTSKVKIAVKFSIVILSFILCMAFTSSKSERFASVPDSVISKIFMMDLIFSIAATLAVIASLYRHFMRLHERILFEQNQLYKAALREIDLEHEKEEYSLLLSLRDDIAQTLVTSRMFLQMIPEKQELVQKADEGVKTAIDGLNNISLELSPAMLIDLGFENGISVYAEMLSKKYNLPLNITLEKNSYSLPDIDRLSLFRIIRQCIDVMVSKGAVSYLNISLRCNNKVQINFEHDSAIQDFETLFHQQELKDLSKRLDYYNAEINEKQGKVEMLLDLKCIEKK